MAAETKRQRLEILRSQLENERSSFMAHWRDLGDHILPRRIRFQTTDTNRGDRRNQKIIDNTATLSARTLRSGMMSGVTSPARPWFKLTTPDPDLAEFQRVKDYLQIVSSRMATMFLRSNLYNVLPVTYGDIGVFGTHAMLIEDDMQEVLRAYPFPIGSYCLANDERLRVNVFYREFPMTVRQLVNRFGRKDASGKPDWSVFSRRVRDLYERGQYEEWIEVCHVIQPNQEYHPRKLQARFKKFASCYFEKGCSEDIYLSESGYDYFPVLAPRWETTAQDVYGTECPGMQSLGDIKALQLMQKRKAQAIDKQINPPLVGDTGWKNQRLSMLPGDVSYGNFREGKPSIAPLHEVNFPLQYHLQDISEHQARIRRAFFEDLFLMLSNDQRSNITAREIEERHEEKLLALGPVLEQLNQDLLDPLIDIGFDLGQRHGLFPEPPEELQGQDLKIEYVSVMAQAQKLVSVGSIERFTNFASGVMQADPRSADKVDTDQLLDVYADVVSLPQGIVRSDEAVAELRDQREQAQAAQAQAEQAAAMAGAAKTLSETDMEGDNALTRLARQSQAGALV